MAGGCDVDGDGLVVEGEEVPSVLMDSRNFRTCIQSVLLLVAAGGGPFAAAAPADGAAGWWDGGCG